MCLSMIERIKNDAYGALAVDVVDGDEDWWVQYEISKNEFEQEWRTHSSSSLNRAAYHQSTAIKGQWSVVFCRPSPGLGDRFRANGSHQINARELLSCVF